MQKESGSMVYKTRLRRKGQLTVPIEIRDMLNLEEGDDIVFFVNEQGRIFVQQLQTIAPEQAWFWTERWQKMEREVQTDIDADQVQRFKDVEDALTFLGETGDTNQ
jgi:antitoxin MazE